MCVQAKDAKDDDDDVEAEDVGNAEGKAEDYAEDARPRETASVCSWISSASLIAFVTKTPVRSSEVVFEEGSYHCPYMPSRNVSRERKGREVAGTH